SERRFWPYTSPSILRCGRPFAHRSTRCGCCRGLHILIAGKEVRWIERRFKCGNAGVVRAIGFDHAMRAFILRILNSIHIDRFLHEGLHVSPAATSPGDDLVRLGGIIRGWMNIHAEVIEPVRKRRVADADPACRAMTLLGGNLTQGWR